MPAADDLKIVQAVLAGDPEAYAPLIRTHHGRVMKVCLMLLANSAEAEDAAQETFVKAYQALRSFQGGSSFSTWISRIAHNHCMDLLRKKSRQKTDSWDALLENHPEAEESLSMSDEVPSIVDPEELADVLSSLRPDYKEILVLREVGALNYVEIAATLNCSLDAVKARLRRARLELQEKARHFWGKKTVQ